MNKKSDNDNHNNKNNMFCIPQFQSIGVLSALCRLKQHFFFNFHDERKVSKKFLKSFTRTFSMFKRQTYLFKKLSIGLDVIAGVADVTRRVATALIIYQFIFFFNLAG